MLIFPWSRGWFPANYAKALQWSRDTVLYIKPKLQDDLGQYQREPGADE